MPFKTSLLILCASLLGASARAAAPAKPDPFATWAPLLGEWVADPDPSGATGGFNFARDLQGQVVVRKNHAEYPASKDRPAASHDDLMVVYLDGGQTRAHYFDNEGHSIEYAVALEDGGKKLVFVSEAKAGQPRFRLSYDASKPDRLAGTFEIAPPGAEQFKPYLSWKAHRKAAAR